MQNMNAGAASGALPRTFGRYRLLRSLGSGGMAQVFQAELVGPGGFATLVALKLIHPHLSQDPSFAASFINEARVGGFLKHPHIVSTIDFGELGGQLFLALEYVEGPTLRQLIRHARIQGERLPLDVSLELLRQIAGALGYAHRATDHAGRPLGMIHRDIKPSNLLVSRFGLAKLSDFGVVRAETNLDRTLGSGELRGTVGYMSPEQALGRLDLDARSDLFSLGVVLHELLTGAQVFSGGMLEQVRQAQLGQPRLRLDLLPPSPDPTGLQALVVKSLAPRPADRFQSGEEFQAALQRQLERLNPRSALEPWLNRVWSESGDESWSASGLSAERPALLDERSGASHGSIGSAVSLWSVEKPLSGEPLRPTGTAAAGSIGADARPEPPQPVRGQRSVAGGKLWVGLALGVLLVAAGIWSSVGERGSPEDALPGNGAGPGQLIALPAPAQEQGLAPVVSEPPSVGSLVAPAGSATTAEGPASAASAPRGERGEVSRFRAQTPVTHELPVSQTAAAPARQVEAEAAPARLEPSPGSAVWAPEQGPSVDVAPARLEPLASSLPAVEGPGATQPLPVPPQAGPAGGGANGSLFIASSPQARITIEGQPSPGYTPTLRSLDYPPGRYRLRLTRPDLNYDLSVEVDVRSGQTTRVTCSQTCEVVGP